MYPERSTLHGPWCRDRWLYTACVHGFDPGARKRAKALRLFRLGLDYRRIAERLGCSEGWAVNLVGDAMQAEDLGFGFPPAFDVVQAVRAKAAVERLVGLLGRPGVAPDPGLEPVPEPVRREGVLLALLRRAERADVRASSRTWAEPGC